MRPAILIVLGLAGCPWVGPGGYDDRVRDRDGDGGIDVRFGGPDCADDDPSIADCDQDGDGALTTAAGGDDCDDTDPSVHPQADERCNGRDDDCDGLTDDDDDVVAPPTWYIDGDGDGVGSPSLTREVCEAGAGWSRSTGDCDDGDPLTRPGVDETCEAVDRNCDGDLYAGSSAVTAWFADLDRDGFGGALQESACTPSDPSWVGNNQDCDDSDAAVSTSSPWYLDQDGDGVGAGVAVAACVAPPNHVAAQGDCDDTDPLLVALSTAYRDRDGDGFGFDDPSDPDDTIDDACALPDGFVTARGDCDDTRATIFPGGDEICNGRDDDCDGVVDDNALNAFTFYEDLDADGFGNGDSPVLACTADASLVTNGDDCNDQDAGSFPGATEICYDTLRQDCLDADLNDCDADGFVDVGRGGDDCDDTDTTRAPGAEERCDGIDNDCDGLLDDADPDVDLSTAGDWYDDLDGDGFGAGTPTFACVPPPQTVANGDDCDDARPELFPGTLWYEDADGDGFGAGPSTTSCTPPSPTSVRFDGDCNDNLAGTYPGASEFCDGVDNDCDGTIDDNPLDGGVFWVDNDGDGYGAPNSSVLACAATAGVAGNPDDCNDADPNSYPDAVEICGDNLRQDCSGFDVADCDRDGELDIAAGGGDCNDQDPTVLPGAPEVCDGEDNDCNGLVDIDDPDVDLGSTRDYYADVDQDGFGDPAAALTSCERPLGYVINATDCDDSNALIAPNADERCATPDDDDCDGLANDADPQGAIDAGSFYADTDGDGDGDALSVTRSCVQPAGTASTGTDCDDAEPTVRQGAAEICDTRDNDCDGLVDDADGNTVGQTLWYQDSDSDGFPRYASFTLSCQPPTASWIADPGSEDCNDANVFINPNQLEGCTPAGTDDDCDGLIDEADPDWVGVLQYRDQDGDGFGNDGVSQAACELVPGYVTEDGDCNDNDNDVNPATVWFRDNDRDGYGDAADSVVSCNPPGDWALRSGDCDDTRADRSPAAPEVCRVGLQASIDEDCDGLVDELDPSLSNGVPHYPDADLDGYGDPNPLLTEIRCLDATDTWYPAFLPADCDDTDTDVRPGAIEVPYDGIDQDCDGASDYDADGDGQDSANHPRPGGQVGPDCDDADPAVRVGALERWYDGVDQDCDGADDYDRDGDGFVVVLPSNWPTPYEGSGSPDCHDGDPAQYPRTLTWTPGENLQALIDVNCDSVIELPAAEVPAVRVLGRRIRFEGPSTPSTTPLADCGTSVACLQGAPGLSAVRVGSAPDPLFPTVTRNGSVELVDLVITGGDAVRGGGLELAPNQQGSSERSVFVDNVAQVAGGALYVGNGATFTGVDTHFLRNRTFSEGGAIAVSSGALALQGGSIEDNQALRSGGIEARRPTELTLQDVRLETNTSPQLQLEIGETDVVLSGIELLRPPGSFNFQIVLEENGGAGAFRIEDSRFGGGNALLLQRYSQIERTVFAPADETFGAISAQRAYVDVDQCLFLGPAGTYASLNSSDTRIANTWVDSPGSTNSSVGLLFGRDGGGLELSHVGFESFQRTTPFGPEPVVGVDPLFVERTNGTLCSGQACLQAPGSTTFEDPLGARLVRFHPQLDPSLWDLHLRPDSPLRGAGDEGQDLGVHPDHTAYDANTDGDGLPDGYELALTGNLTLTAGGDPDNDTLTNLQEYQLGTHPLLADTDGDGLRDDAEQGFSTNPLAADTDGDGRSDFDELFGTPTTDPLLWDTDGDRVGDQDELQGWTTFGGTLWITDPNLADTDNDGLDDRDEAEGLYQTSPVDPDTDGDGLLDGVEVNGPNGDPFIRDWESNPTVVDTDGDGLSDAIELGYPMSGAPCMAPVYLDPFQFDSDLDGLGDAEEVALGTCATHPDTDGDTVNDGVDAAPLDPLVW